MPVRRTFTRAASASGTLRLAVALAGTAMVTIAAAASPAAAAPSQRADRAGASQVSAAQDHVLAIASQAPRVPSVIGETQGTAALDLQAAGYVLGRVAVVIDLTCEYIGVVKTQSPTAGTFATPGTSVSVAIGKAGGKCL